MLYLYKQPFSSFPYFLYIFTKNYSSVYLSSFLSLSVSQIDLYLLLQKYAKDHHQIKNLTIIPI